jgi:hypothetical protein
VFDGPTEASIPRGKDDEWTEQEMLEALRELEAETGRPFTAHMSTNQGIRSGAQSRRGRYPSSGALLRHQKGIEHHK